MELEAGGVELVLLYHACQGDSLCIILEAHVSGVYYKSAW